MADHKSLTGADLHEPKGAASATSGQVYVADGVGSGAWMSRLSGIYNVNSYSLNGSIADVSAPNTSFFVNVPYKGTLSKIFTVLSGPITVADSTVTIYKNSIAQTPTLTIPYTGSGAGVSQTFTPAISVLEGDVMEFRTNGASDTTAVLSVVAKFTAAA